jgi:CBS domain-containing protein
MRNINLDSKTKDRPITVADVMTRHVITLGPHHSLSESVSLMAKYSFRHFIVVDVRGRLAGVVSDREILRALPRATNWNTTSVSQFMTRDVLRVQPNTKLSVAVGRMLSKRVNCLPVVDDDQTLRGIVTSTDLLKTFRFVQVAIEKDVKVNAVEETGEQSPPHNGAISESSMRSTRPGYHSSRYI